MKKKKKNSSTSETRNNIEEKDNFEGKNLMSNSPKEEHLSSIFFLLRFDWCFFHKNQKKLLLLCLKESVY
jgi:hypothetical protein